MRDSVLLKKYGRGSRSHYGSAIVLAIRNWLSRAALLTCALCLLVSSRAWADSRVVVRAFKGPKGAQLRAVVIEELKDRGFEVVANKEVDRMAKARGVGADEPAGRAEVGRELTIHAWVDGRVSRTGGAFTTVISVQEGYGAEQVAELTVTRKQSGQLVAVVRRELWKTAGPALEKARAPEPPSPSGSKERKELAPQNEATVIVPQSAPVERPSNLDWPADVNVNLENSPRDEPAARAETNEEKKKERELSAVEAHVSLNTLTRTLRFRDAFAHGVSDYQLAAAPLVMGSLRVYPGAFAKAPIASYIGLDGSAQRAFGLGSKSAEGLTYKTKFEGYTGSLVGRVPFAGHELNLLAGYGLQRFLLGKSAGTSPVPGVEYRHIRLSGAGRFALGSRTKLGIDASWLMIVGTGQLSSAAWFPGSAGFGLEGALYVDVRVFGGLAVRARASYQRSVFDFAPQQNKQRNETGAVDTYITAGVGLSYAY